MTESSLLRNILRACVLLGSLVLGVAGCGQKGDLYLPKTADSKTPAPKAATPPATRSSKALPAEGVPEDNSAVTRPLDAE